MRRCSFLVLAAMISIGGCGSDGDDPAPPEQQTVNFAGEAAALPDVAINTGWEPFGEPIQVKLTFDVEGTLSAAADALVGGTATAPILSGKAGTGTYDLSMKLVFQALIKLDFAGADYEGPISEDTDISYEISGQTTFDPFSLAEATLLTAEIPRVELARIPIGPSVPGVTGDLVIHISGTVTSYYQGLCAAISDTSAVYNATTSTDADLILEPSVEISIPLLGEKSLPVFDIPVKIPGVAAAIDLGTHDVTPSGGPVDGGGEKADVGDCEHED